MSFEMPALAVHRNGDAGLDPAIELLELAAAGVARDVDGLVLIRDDLDAQIRQAVLHAPYGLFVAGDGARRKDHPVTLFEFDIGMLALRHARERRARLALAPGAQGNDLARRELAEDGFVVEFEIGVEIAGRLGRLDHAEHGPADDDEFAAGGAGGLGDGAETGNV